MLSGRAYGRQLSVVEADWGVESPAGHLSISSQEVVVVDPAVALDPVARVATQFGPLFVHCSFVTFTLILFPIVYSLPLRQ